MPNVLVSSGEETISVTSHDWVTVLEIPDDLDVNWLVLINEGGSPGWWRLLYPDDETTPSARIPGTSTSSIPVPDGFAGGKLQVKRTIAEGDLSGLSAWATHSLPTDDEEDDEVDERDNEQ